MAFLVFSAHTLPCPHFASASTSCSSASSREKCEAANCSALMILGGCSESCLIYLLHSGFGNHWVLQRVSPQPRALWAVTPSTWHRAGQTSGCETGCSWDITMLVLKRLLPGFSKEQGGAALPSLHKPRSPRVWAGAAKFPRAGLSGRGREKKQLRMGWVLVLPHGRGKELTPRKDTNAVSCWQPHHDWSNMQKIDWTTGCTQC